MPELLRCVVVNGLLLHSLGGSQILAFAKIIVDLKM